MIEQTRTQLMVTLCVTSMVIGCMKPQQQQNKPAVVPVGPTWQQVQAEHARQLQIVEEKAAATATSRGLQSQLSAVDRARKEGQVAGEAMGKVAAMEQLFKREAEARAEGEEVGRALAAAEEYRKGQEHGERYGEIKARLEAKEEVQQEMAKAVAKAEENGKKLGLIEGVEQGKEYQRRQDYYKVASVALAISAGFVSLALFVGRRLEPMSARQMKRLLDHERRREKERLAEWQLAEANRVAKRQVLEDRLLTIVEGKCTNQVAQDVQKDRDGDEGQVAGKAGT